MPWSKFSDARIVVVNFDGIGYVRISKNQLIELCNLYLHTEIEKVELCPHGFENWDDCPDCRH